MRTIKVLTLATAAALALSGCIAKTSDNVPIVEGPPVTDIETPYDRALVCLREQMTAQNIMPAYVAIGEIADRTGRSLYLERETINVTQGAGDMVSSAVQTNGIAMLVERLDTRVLMFEQQAAMKKILGDGVSSKVMGTDGKSQNVSYRPIPFGSLQGSQFYVVGSINSLDWAISSAGASVEIAGIGPRARQGRGLVGIDIRVVDTKTGRVVATKALHRQIVANVGGGGAFRFWGTTLLNIDVGGQESTPLNFMLRGMLNLAVYDVMSETYSVDVTSCDKELEGSESMVEGS